MTGKYTIDFNTKKSGNYESANEDNGASLRVYGSDCDIDPVGCDCFCTDCNCECQASLDSNNQETNRFQFFPNISALFSHYNKRLEQLELLLQDNAANQALLEEKATILRHLGNNQQVFDIYNAILIIDPKSISTLLNRASLSHEQGNSALALRDITTVLKIDPQNAMAEEMRKIIASAHANFHPR